MNPVGPMDIAPRQDVDAQIQRLEAFRGDSEKLRKAAKGFEAMVLAEILRPMENMGGGLLGKSMGSRFARGMYHDAVVEKVANAGGIGLADLVIQQLTRTAAVSQYQTQTRAAAVWPIQSTSIGAVGSRFGMRADPFTGAQRMHNGIDIDASQGAPVFPVRDGEVIFAGSRGGYGKLVIVEHDGGLQSWYAHLADIDVEEGERLGGDQSLGRVGSTGRSTGPHLHLEMRRGGIPEDPLTWLE